MEKIEVLSMYLECEEDEISEGYEEYTFEYGRQKYLVCTEEEADKRCEDYILDTLWAFNTSFIMNYIDTRTDYDDKSLRKCLVALQELCEYSNYLIKLLVGNRIDEFIENAINLDGRGHYLSPFDGVEKEYSVFTDEGTITYYIYRID